MTEPYDASVASWLALNVTWWSLLFTSMIGLMVTGPPNSLLARMFNLAPLRFVGAYSYGLYLVHESILRELGARLPTAHGPALFH